MIVKQTCGNMIGWYCFGIESLQQCLDVGPALGSYANSPDLGAKEVVNCNLERTKAFTCKDETGKEMMGYPMYSTRIIQEGEPSLWSYLFTAGRGRNYFV
jgi:hypothetical protein